MALKNVLGAVLLALFIVFVIQNLSQVTVNFLFFPIVMRVRYYYPEHC